MGDSDLLRADQKRKQSPSKRHQCPETWQVALLLCCISIFFLSGVLLGSYVGAMHSCKRGGKDESTPSRLKQQDLGGESDQLTYIEILHKHQRILMLIRNSSLESSFECSGDPSRDEVSKFEKFLSNMNLYEVKSLSYPAFATHKRLILDFVYPRKFRIHDSAHSFQLTSPRNLSLQAYVTLVRDVAEYKESLEGKFVLMESDQETIAQNIERLAQRKAKGVILYSPSGTCLPQTALSPLKGGISDQIEVQVLSCAGQMKLLSFLKDSSATDKNEGNLIEENTATDPNAHLSLHLTFKPTNLTNVLTTFYGSRDPDLIILVGASRCNVEGTDRWLKMLQGVADGLFRATKEQVWSPYRSIKFLSWSHLGVSDFLKTYGVAWKHKVLVYLHLDNPDSGHHSAQHSNNYPPTNTIQLEVSPSLRPFVIGVVQKLNFRNINSFSVEVLSGRSLELEGSIPQLLESSMGIPYMRIYRTPVVRKGNKRRARSERKKNSKGVSPNNWDEMILKFFAQAMMSMVDSELVEISTFETSKELLQMLQLIRQEFPTSKNILAKDGGESDKNFRHLDVLMESLHASSSRLCQVAEAFEKTLKMFEETFMSTYHTRKTNDLLLRVENELRTTIHHLSPMLQIYNINHPPNLSNYTFNHHLKSSIHSHLSDHYSSINSLLLTGLSYFNSNCLNHVGGHIEELLYGLSQINLKINGLIKCLNLRE